MKRKNFSFRYEWLEAMDNLVEEEQMEIVLAVAHFHRYGEIEQLTSEADIVFQKHIVPTLLKRRKAAQYRARLKAKRKEAEEARKKQAELQPEAPDLHEGQVVSLMSPAIGAPCPKWVIGIPPLAP